MTFDEAYSEAILGAWVRAVDMQPGSYISYNFSGLRINFEGGSSSGWTPRDRDREVEWEICGPPEAPKCNCAGVVEWNTVCPIHDKPEPQISGFVPGSGKRPGEREWGDVMGDMEKVEGGWRAKPETSKWGTAPTRNPEPQRDKWGRPQ